MNNNRDSNYSSNSNSYNNSNSNMNNNYNNSNMNNNYNTQQSDESSTVRQPMMFNIAEMKRLTQERLLQQKKQQNIRSPSKFQETHLIANPRIRGNQQKTVVKEVSIPYEGCTLRELASRMSMKLIDVKNKLLELGETVDGTAVSEQPVRAKGVRRRGMRARIALAKGTEGDSYIEADVGELVVLEMGLQPKR